MMEGVNTSETSGNLYQTTRRKIPEGSHFHCRRRENLKSHQRNTLLHTRCNKQTKRRKKGDRLKEDRENTKKDVRVKQDK
jgi:hypothetical protein